MKRLIAISLLFIACQTSQAIELPNDFDAVYSMEKYGTVVAKMQLRLQQQDGSIIYESHSKAKGMLALFSDEHIDEISQLQWDKTLEHARLQNYQFIRKNKKSKNQQFSLSWDMQNNASVTGTYAGKVFNLNADGFIWDRLSVQLALAADLKSASEIKKKYSYNIIDQDQIIQYHFEYLQAEILQIDNRQYNTIKIKRPNAEGTRITFLWLSKELDYLPVKIEQYQNDELNIRMTLDNYTLKQNKL